MIPETAPNIRTDSDDGQGGSPVAHDFRRNGPVTRFAPCGAPKRQPAGGREAS